jgi:uncharacterized membrane protein YhhN
MVHLIPVPLVVVTAVLLVRAAAPEQQQVYVLKPLPTFLACVLIICLMVNRVLSAFLGDAFTLAQAWLLSAGATLFGLWDLVLAINRFRRPLSWNGLGLFRHFGGQMLIALSPSYFG